MLTTEVLHGTETQYSGKNGIELALVMYLAMGERCS